MLPLLTLAPGVKQVAAGCGERLARNVTPASLPSARAILMPHGTASGRFLDRVCRRNGLELHRVEQAAPDLFVDRYQLLATGSAPARTPASMGHRGPRQEELPIVHTILQPSQRAGSDEGPIERERRASPGTRRGLTDWRYRRRMRRIRIDSWRRRPRGRQWRYGRRLAHFEVRLNHLNRS